jgi:hypothetical protein
MTKESNAALELEYRAKEEGKKRKKTKIKI